MGDDLTRELDVAIYIHPSAVVDEPAQIGEGTKIWHFTHVMHGAAIGARCNLGQNVFVAAGVTIGDGCKIQNNVSLYEGVTLEEDVFCGPSMVFTNVRNPRAEFPVHGVYAPTRVGKGATLGANCTIVCGVTIGRFAFIAAGAVVNRDVPAYAMMAGVPARRIGWAGPRGERLVAVEGDENRENIKTSGETPLPRIFYRCPVSGEIFVQVGPDELRPEPGE